MSYTVDQVAELVNVHPQTVRSEIRAGHLEAWKAGGAVRIEPEALQMWKKRKQVSQPAKKRRGGSFSGRLRAIEGGASE